MVYYWERKTSNVEFVNTARQLKIRICQAVANKNYKAFTFYGSQKLAEYAMELFHLCNNANIYPTNRQEVEYRQLQIKLAQSMLSTLSAQFMDVDDMLHFKDSTRKECSDLMEQEDRLLKGVLESDRKRFSRLV